MLLVSLAALGAPSGMLTGRMRPTGHRKWGPAAELAIQVIESANGPSGRADLRPFLVLLSFWPLSVVQLSRSLVGQKTVAEINSISGNS